VGVTYRIEDQAGIVKWLRENVRSTSLRTDLLQWMRKTFMLGELPMRLEGAVDVKRDREQVVRQVLAFCRENQVGTLHEGFWADHWHYNFDLLDVILMVYPDHLRNLLLERKNYTFFDNPDVVLSRAERVVDVGGKIRQYGAVVRDPQKERNIRVRKVDPYTVRTHLGKGEIYHTNLLIKLLCIVTNRLATLDPAGTGIEMEAGKPGWNDAMNGLPGLFGSGLSELLELRKAIRFLLDALNRINLPSTRKLLLYEELASFLRSLRRILRKRLRSSSDRSAFKYWDTANTVKESYREKTKFGVSGKEVSVSVGEIQGFLSEAKDLLDSTFKGSSRRKVLSHRGIPYTYFVNEVIKHRPLGRKNHLGYPLVRPLAFRQRPVKLFLEGAVHWIKDQPKEARKIHTSLRRSKIYDQKLKLYKLCEDMTGESHELGRAVGAYPRGWIENESIYLHMHYKYLLEILRSGLYEEFWMEARTGLIPFMDPAVYGRSTLEGASFVVSSAYPDPRLHGRAFQPRLSGLTSEFLNIWMLAVAGEQPLRIGAHGQLELALKPRLPGWLFTNHACVRSYYDLKEGWCDMNVQRNSFAFKLLGRVLVVYHNEKRKPTFGPRGVKPVLYRLEYRDRMLVEHRGHSLTGPHPEAIRKGAVRRIDVTLR